MNALICVYVSPAWLCPGCRYEAVRTSLPRFGSLRFRFVPLRFGVCPVRERFVAIRFEGGPWLEHVRRVRCFDGCGSARFGSICGGSHRLVAVRGDSWRFAVCFTSCTHNRDPPEMLESHHDVLHGAAVRCDLSHFGPFGEKTSARSSTI